MNKVLNKSVPTSTHSPTARVRKPMTIPKTILSILWEIGEGTVKAFFPHPYSHAFCHHRNQQNFHVALNQLTKRKLITKTANQTFCLTTKGQREAFWAHLDTKLILDNPTNQKWDGNWRMIFFDIPEKKRKLRDDLRSVLKTLGFKELQKSIWVTPYKIPDLLNELLWEEKIKHYTRFITIKEIDYDKDLKRSFKLV